MISTLHDAPDILEDTRKEKPVVIDFYNSQRCGLDIVNEMLKDISSQPVSNNWAIVVFTFILDLCAINSCTIFKYNCPNDFNGRREFLRLLALQFCVPHLIERLKQPGVQSQCKSAIKTILKDDDVQPPIDEGIFNEPMNPDVLDLVNRSKCYCCIIDLEGLPDAERRRRKGNLKKQRNFCNICKRGICPRHIQSYCCENYN